MSQRETQLGSSLQQWKGVDQRTQPTLVQDGFFTFAIGSFFGLGDNVERIPGKSLAGVIDEGVFGIFQFDKIAIIQGYDKLYIAPITELIDLNLLPIPKTPVARTYVSDGDANGVLYFLGELVGGGSWVNPVTVGGVEIAVNYATINPVSAWADRTTNDMWVGPGAGAYFAVDLGEDRELLINYLSFRQRTTGKFDALADLLLEGSTVGLVWETILTKTAAEVPSGSNVWASWAVVGQTTPYRYFRFSQPASTSYLTCCEVELYGTFYYYPPE